MPAPDAIRYEMVLGLEVLEGAAAPEAPLPIDGAREEADGREGLLALADAEAARVDLVGERRPRDVGRHRRELASSLPNPALHRIARADRLPVLPMASQAPAHVLVELARGLEAVVAELEMLDEPAERVHLEVRRDLVGEASPSPS